jgi:hypothetical protein
MLARYGLESIRLPNTKRRPRKSITDLAIRRNYFRLVGVLSIEFTTR